MAEHDQDQTEQATPYKLKEAQRRGQVAKSTEVNFTAVLGAFVLVVFAAGVSISLRELGNLRGLLAAPPEGDWASDSTAHWILSSMVQCVSALAPIFLAVVCAVILSSIAQTGGVFSFEPIKPDFNRVNPASGFKRLFSMRLIYDAGRSVVKLVVLCAVLWVTIKQLLPDLYKLTYIDAHAHAHFVLGAVPPLLFKLLLAMMAIALLDLGYTRFEYGKKMRMSRREVRDEHKQREGDPRIRSRLRQLRAQLLKQSQSVKKLPDADVLLTNPTHYAVALSYRHGEMPAPKLIAKGAGSLAAKMRTKARQLNIPVVENPPLTRELYKRTDFDQFVPEDMYPKIAKIMIWVYAMRKARNSTAGAAA